MNRLVAINGYKGSGKDEFGEMLIYLYNLRATLGSRATAAYWDNYKYLTEANVNSYTFSLNKGKFASKLKQMTSDLTGVAVFQMETQEEKGLFLPKFNCTLREFMIKLAEEFIKPNFGKDFFAKAAFDGYDPKHLKIITDLRFKTELKEVLDRKGIILRVVRFKDFKSTDPTENELDDIKVHAVINNFGDKAELFAKAHIIAKKLWLVK